MPVKLVAKQGFTSFGKDYAAGAVVDPGEAAKWADNAMAKRLNNGFLEYRDVPDDEAEAIATETDHEAIQRASNAAQLPPESQSVEQDTAGPKFNTMSTEDLDAFAKQNDLVVDVAAAGGIRAQRAAVREAYAAKLASAPLGGKAAGAGPAA